MDKENPILRRIIGGDSLSSSQSSATSVVDVLTNGLNNSDLQSLLLHIYEERTKRSSTRDILSQYQVGRFTVPSEFDQRDFNKLDGKIFSLVPNNFQALELSPVNPLGLNALLTKTNQKNVLSTIRNSEVIADATTAISLECAIRRTVSPDDNVDVCTSQRTIRLQKYEEGSGFTSHFRVFAMCSAGRDQGREEFEKQTLGTHIDTYLNILNNIGGTDEGYKVNDIEVTISDIGVTEKVARLNKFQGDDLGRNIRQRAIALFGNDLDLPIPLRVNRLSELPEGLLTKYDLSAEVERLGKVGESIFTKLSQLHPGTKFVYELDRTGGMGYYQGLCFKIEATNRDAETYQLVDGGFTDWTQILLSNKKERLMTSGLGTEFLMRKFR